MASATSIRAAALERRQDPATMAGFLRAHMPASSLALMTSAMLAGEAPVFSDDLAVLALGMLRTMSQSTLDTFAGMDEGLSARLAEAAAKIAVFRRKAIGEILPARGLVEELLAAAATRRFASTRIRRALAAMMVGLTKEDLALFDAAGVGPRYLRILGFNRKGRRLLGIMRKRAKLPIVMNASDFLEHGSEPAFVRMAALDVIATDVWMLSRGIPCGRDFDTPPVMV